MRGERNPTVPRNVSMHPCTHAPIPCTAPSVDMSCGGMAVVAARLQCCYGPEEPDACGVRKARRPTE